MRTSASLTLPSRRRRMAILGVTFLALLTACQPATSADDDADSRPTPVIDQGVASISFDDGTIGQYTHALPVLRGTSVPATYYLVSDALGWGNVAISPDQARQLVAEGHEIGNHTKDHKDLADMTAAQVTAQFAESQEAIETQVGVRPTTCAYPHGSSNAGVRAEAEKHFRGCRSTRGGLNQRSELARYDLYSYYVLQDTTAADVREAAARARASNTWIVFVYHDVEPDPKEPDDVTPERFAAHVEAITSTGIPVRTVASALAVMTR